jgi:hypothetical protein
MVEHGQGEGRLGDEHVARHRLEGRAGRIGAALVVAGDDDALALVLEHSLCGAEDVTGGHEAHRDAADGDAFAVFQRLLAGIRHVLEAGAHDRQGFRRGERAAMARPGVIAVAVGDHGAAHRHGGVDIEIAGLTIEAARRRVEPGARVERVGRH